MRINDQSQKSTQAGMKFFKSKGKYIVNTHTPNKILTKDTQKKPLPILGNEKQYSEAKNRYGTTPALFKSKLPDYDVLKYPVAVVFVLASKFFEAFAANGVRTVLALFTRDALHQSEDESTTILHVFNFFSQFFPILGAVLADSYLGNSKTLFIFYIPYAIGYTGLLLTSLPMELFSTTQFVIVFLVLISIGNGNLRACITSLGGSQFQLPEQKAQLDQYFSHYYFVYTLGILLSKIIPPSVRSNVHCFGGDTCYTAVFGMLCLVFFASWFCFLVGLCFYKPEHPNHSNVLFKTVNCLIHAGLNKLKGKLQNCNDALASVTPTYGEHFVNDVRSFLNLIVLFIPLPIYWALLTQQDSTWTFQATQLDTKIYGFHIEADQVKAIGPLLLLIQIPVWQRYAIPFLEKLGHHVSPLHSVTLGGFSASLSFACAGILQIVIEQSSRKPSVVWQLPQFFLLQMGEVLLAIPGLQFAFTRAPQSMKSVVTAVWFCNNAFGNLIVVLATEFKPPVRQSQMFFLYSMLMLVGIVIFSFLAQQYEKTHDDTDVIASEEQVIEKFVYVEELTMSNMELNALGGARHNQSDQSIESGYGYSEEWKS